MANNFLDLLERERGDCDYCPPAAESAKAAAAAAARLPEGQRWEFAFATGVECSNPIIAGRDGCTIRRDQLAECGHYSHLAEDLRLVRELGLWVLRYGLPYHLVNPARGRYDWSFADCAMREIERLGIIPILDLLHFGVPDWLGNFQNPELPLRFAEYAGEVVARYPWVRFYTPVNEIYVAARASGRDGVWNEQLKTDRGFVTALKHLAAANILATKEIVRHRPDAVIIQSETAEYTHHLSAHPSAEVKLTNQLGYLALDLLYGNAPDADVVFYLLDAGMTRREYEWFMQGEAPGYHVMGNDYYGRNEQMLLPDGTRLSGEDVLGWYLITKRYYERYYKPVMHTETNVFDAARAPAWLWKQWANVLRMRRDGVPVLGFTWYSLTDQIDWDTGLAEKNDRVNECGLYDLERRPRPVAHAYRQLLEEFGQISTLAHGEMFELTGRPAASRVVV